MYKRKEAARIDVALGDGFGEIGVLGDAGEAKSL